MIQLSFELRGAVAGPAPEPLRLAPVAGGARLTGVWPAGLAAARAQVAGFLATVPPAAPVIDLLLGLEETAAAAADRLAKPPTAARCLHARQCVIEGTRWIRLFGLYQLGRSDLVAAVEPDVDLDDAYRLMTRLGEAHLRHPDSSPLPRDRPFAFGYWLLGEGGAELADDAFWRRLKQGLGSHHLARAFDERMETPPPRFVLEADDVTWAEPDRWVFGVSRAVRTFSAQARACDRFEAGALLGAPNANDAIMLCDRLDAADSFFAYREAPLDPNDSGWRFACLDPDHRHDEASSRLSNLRHLTARFPELVQYLALPPGWVVSREGGAWWVTPAGTERTFEDQGYEPGAPWTPRAAAAEERP